MINKDFIVFKDGILACGIKNPKNGSLMLEKLNYLESIVLSPTKNIKHGHSHKTCE